jgi:hypothetical protein
MHARLVARLVPVAWLTVCTLVAAPPQQAPDPAARYAVSAALGRDDPSYHATVAAGASELVNAPHGLRAVCDERGAMVRAHGHDLGLGLARAGHGDSLRPCGDAARAILANRVEYRRAGVTEWYVNGPLGLQQGFTVDARPADATGPLTLVLALADGIEARVDADARGLTLLHGDWSVARYAGLLAFDASGRALAAALTAVGREIVLRVDDGGARYPIVVDPFVETAALRASNTHLGNWFGWSVALHGDTMVIGCPHAKVGTQVEQGCAYVFTKGPTGWTEAGILTSTFGRARDHMGGNVAIHGDTIAVTKGLFTIGSIIGPNAAINVFERPAGGWTTMNETVTLSPIRPGEGYGSGLAVSEDAIYVGATKARVGEHSPGAVYVYRRPAGGWTRNVRDAVRLSAYSGLTGDGQLGRSVAVEGNTLVAGARDNMGLGAVFVFERPPGGWTNSTGAVARLTASKPTPGAALGLCVAISGNTIVAGAPNHDFGLGSQGAAYVFVKPPDGWVDATESAVLLPSDTAFLDQFGSTVAIDDDVILVGKRLAEVNGQLNQGAAYVYLRPPTGWRDATETQVLVASDGITQDRFGVSVALGDNTALIGAFHWGNNGQGSAYVFENMATAVRGAPPELARAEVPGHAGSRVLYFVSPERRPSRIPGIVELDIGASFTSLWPVAALPAHSATGARRWYWQAVRYDPLRRAALAVSEVGVVRLD